MVNLRLASVFVEALCFIGSSFSTVIRTHTQIWFLFSIYFSSSWSIFLFKFVHLMCAKCLSMFFSCIKRENGKVHFHLVNAKGFVFPGWKTITACVSVNAQNDTRSFVWFICTLCIYSNVIYLYMYICWY